MAAPAQFDPGITQSYDGPVDRILRPDGRFNVHRRGGRLRDLHVYQLLISLSWPAFVAVVVGIFVLMNLAFTGLYVATGIDGLQGLGPGNGDLLHVFFFSVQTMTTVGYGVVSPHGVPANVIASLEAMLGVMGFAFAAGLLYGRFARPVARILFSDRAVVAPFRGGTGLMFRLANRRSNAIADLEATVVLMTIDGKGREARRNYALLELERSTVYFLPLTWTVVHPIDAASPLAGLAEADLAARSAEILVIIRGFDDTFNQVVHARRSYRFDEILWGRRFLPAFHHDDGGRLTLDLARIDATTEAPLPAKAGRRARRIPGPR